MYNFVLRDSIKFAFLKRYMSFRTDNFQNTSDTAQSLKFSIKDVFSKCDPNCGLVHVYCSNP